MDCSVTSAVIAAMTSLYSQYADFVEQFTMASGINLSAVACQLLTAINSAV